MANKKYIYKTLVLSVVITFLFNNINVNAGDKLIDRYPVNTNQIQAEDAYHYMSYLSDGKAKELVDAQAEITVNLNTLKSEKSLIGISNSNSVIWQNRDCNYIEFDFNSDMEGYYNLEVEYMALKGTSESPRRSIKIDGKEPYSELNSIVFDRIWTDDNIKKFNAVGDMINPKQIEIFEKQSVRISDYLGRYSEPLKIYLSKGKHTIRFEYICEPMELFSIKFKEPKLYNTYNEKLKEYISKGYPKADNTIKIDAEEPYRKSDSSLRLEFSGDPKADPVAEGNYILNTIGGPSWNKGNQTITYRFKVLKAGLYKIGIRTYQKYTDGLDVYRQISIDNEVPFKEFLNYKFTYGDWQNTVLENDKMQPYLIYFDKGYHQIAFSVKTSSYTEILLNLEKTLNRFSKVVREIIKVTSISPDPNFDYELDIKLPWLMSDLKEISNDLDTQIKMLKEKAKKTPGPVNSLAEIKYRIDKMIEKPFIIPKNLTALIDSQTTLSSWIKSFNNSPLMLDYFEIAAPDINIERGRSNFIQIFMVSIKNFIRSFYKDYDNISGLKKGENSKQLNVWVSRGKEWGEILKQISDEEFTSGTGVNVSMNILPAGQLGTGGIMLLAVASGTAPDIVIGSDSTVPAEYGMRDVLVDLSKLPDFEKISKRFLDGVKTPYKFKNHVYALPETMDFSILYYRKDILKELNIELPNTWNELYQKVIPTLKRNGMDFWYEGGMNTFLFQNGGKFYSEDGRISALGSRQSIDAFKQFAELYTIYKVPYEANFYTRFRSGQMPIGISSFNTYLLITSAAPELQGKWDVALIPGTEKADGTVDHSNNISSSSVMIFKSCKDINNAWKFLDWYTSKDTQLRYAADLVSYIGPEAKWTSANVEAFDAMSWENNFRKVLAEQRKQSCGIPSVVGGYITARQLENARVRTVLQGLNYRTSIEKAASDISRELNLKNQEFEARNQKIR